MKFLQKTLTLEPKKRGFHLITSDIIESLPEISHIEAGMLHLFILHTSASLTISENADSDVGRDLESVMNHLVPENLPFLKHTCEGPDDMPAHVKSTLIGPSLQIPISQGKLVLGTWQGIFLCEHRDRARSRQVFCSLFG